MENPGKTQNKIVETYAGDMAKIIEDDKSGLVKKIIEGEEKHETEKKNLSPESTKNKLFIFGSAALVVVAFSILFFLFLNKDVNTVLVEEQFVPIISSDQSNFIEIDGFGKDKIIQTVMNTISASLIKNRGVGGIYLTENKKIIGLRKFVLLTKSSFSPGDSNLVYDNFLLGFVNNPDKPALTPQGGDFFMLIKVRSLPDVFDPLRAFENKMLFDLHGFFKVDVTPETNYLFTKNFDDGIVENKNARI